MSWWNYTDAESDGKDAQKPQVSSLLRSWGQGKAVICRDRLVGLANVDTQYKTPFSSGVLQKTSFITFFKKSLQVLQMLLLKNLSNPQITFYPFL